MCPGSAAPCCCATSRDSSSPPAWASAAALATAADASLLGLRVSLKVTCPSSPCSRRTSASSSAASVATAPSASGWDSARVAASCSPGTLLASSAAVDGTVVCLKSGCAGGRTRSEMLAASAAAAAVALVGWLEGGAPPCTTSSVSSFSSSACRQNRGLAELAVSTADNAQQECKQGAGPRMRPGPGISGSDGLGACQPWQCNMSLNQHVVLAAEQCSDKSTRPNVRRAVPTLASARSLAYFRPLAPWWMRSMHGPSRAAGDCAAMTLPLPLTHGPAESGGAAAPRAPADAGGRQWWVAAV